MVIYHNCVGHAIYVSEQCPKGKVSNVLLGIMPLICTPFKQVDIDLIGPIIPISNRGLWHILTTIDYSTRYLGSVSLRTICKVEVAEAMLNVYRRELERNGL